MRKPGELAKNVWYAVGTEINIAGPLFQLPIAAVLLYRVLREAGTTIVVLERFGFELRGLKLEGARLTFYIKPDDGLELPLIMQWLKQTFSARFNWLTGRSGHVWGDRYESEILWEGPPESAKAVDWAAVNEAARQVGRSLPKQAASRDSGLWGFVIALTWLQVPRICRTRLLS